MGRPYRTALGGYVYHMLNRANGRLPIFHKNGDYDAFERILGEALEHVPGMRLLAYCLMPNHWHLVVWPRRDGELSDFGHWLTLTHTQRWHAHYRDVGTGHLYQGRFKSFPVGQAEHFLGLCRYVERNAVRAGLVGGLVTTLYDARGNVTGTIDALNHLTTFTVDALNRQTQVQDALGNLSTTVFDFVGNVSTTIDARGDRTTYSFDSHNRQTQVQD